MPTYYDVWRLSNRWTISKRQRQRRVGHDITRIEIYYTFDILLIYKKRLNVSPCGTD